MNKFTNGSLFTIIQSQLDESVWFMGWKCSVFILEWRCTV